MFIGCNRLYAESIADTANIDNGSGRLTAAFHRGLQAMNIRKQAFASCKRSFCLYNLVKVLSLATISIAF
jgi:hypothetical protein